MIGACTGGLRARMHVRVCAAALSHSGVTFRYDSSLREEKTPEVGAMDFIRPTGRYL